MTPDQNPTPTSPAQSENSDFAGAFDEFDSVDISPPGEGGGESAPAVSPAPAAPGAPVPSGAPGTGTQPVQAGTQAAPAVGSPAAAPATSPQAAPAVASPSPVAQPAPAAPVQPQPIAQPQAPVQPAAAPDVGQPKDFLSAWDQGREALTAQLAQRFVLSPADIEMMGIAPEGAQHISRIAGQVLFESISSAQRLIQQQVPAIIQGEVERLERGRRNEEAFYSKYPMLRDPAHRDTVSRFTKVWRAANPQGSLAQAIEEIGALSCMHLKLPMPGAIAPVVAAQPQPARVVAQSAPFRPAAAGASAAVAQELVNDDPWSGAFEA